MNSAPNANSGSAACLPQRRLRRPVNAVLHRKRRPATVLSITALVVMLEKEWTTVDVSVMRVRIHQLPTLRAAVGRYGELEVLGGTGRSCTVVFWNDDRTGSPADGRLRRRPSSLPLTGIFPDLGPDAGTEPVPSGHAAFGIDPNRGWPGKTFSRPGVIGGCQPYGAFMVDNANHELGIGPLLIEVSGSPMFGPAHRPLVGDPA
jgi:hypothetical protein